MMGPLGVWQQSYGATYYRFPLKANVRHFSVYDGALTDAQMHTATTRHSSTESICPHLRPHGAHPCHHLRQYPAITSIL